MRAQLKINAGLYCKPARVPELFVPDTAGTIIPNHMLRELAAKDAARKAARRDSAAAIEAAARCLFQTLH